MFVEKVCLHRQHSSHRSGLKSLAATISKTCVPVQVDFEDECLQHFGFLYFR